MPRVGGVLVDGGFGVGLLAAAGELAKGVGFGYLKGTQARADRGSRHFEHAGGLKTKWMSSLGAAGSVIIEGPMIHWDCKPAAS